MSKALNDVGITPEMLACNKVQVSWKNKGYLCFEVFPFYIDGRGECIEIISYSCENDFLIKKIILKPENNTLQTVLYCRDGEKIFTDEKSISIKFL